MKRFLIVLIPIIFFLVSLVYATKDNSDDPCLKKVVFKEPMCMAECFGYQFNQETGKCEEAWQSSCCYTDSPFTSLKECQAQCENNKKGLRTDDIQYCDDTSWYHIFQDDKGYIMAYDEVSAPEESFMGKITYDLDANCESMILMRCTPYKLDGVSVYTGSENLEKYKGYKVEIVGKKHSFPLEDVSRLTEIWPIKIRCIKK